MIHAIRTSTPPSWEQTSRSPRQTHHPTMDHPSSPAAQPWPVRDRFLELHSRWMTLIGEHLQDPQGNLLEYWRIEKADSVIVLPIQGDRLLLPAASYRPGIGQSTWDFPGGRIAADQHPEQAAIVTLTRELGITADSITQLIPLNTEGWAVNSSFSNQKLYSFVAYIDNDLDSQKALNPTIMTFPYPANLAELQPLLKTFTCLQCRAVLWEWWSNFRSIEHHVN